MGFLLPIFATIGTGIAAAGATVGSTIAAVGSTVGTALGSAAAFAGANTAGALAADLASTGAGLGLASTGAAAATAGSFLSGASTLASLGLTIAGAVSKPKAPAPVDLAPTTPIAPPTFASPVSPVGGAQNRSLAAMSPALALSGTYSNLGPSTSSSGKTLLGN